MITGIAVMEKIIVYTAITNGYDTLKPVPASWRGQCEFVAFTEQTANAMGWSIRTPCADFSDPVRNARDHKIMAHKWLGDNIYSIWVDGSVFVKATCSPQALIDQCLAKNDLAVHKHHTRCCVYDEAIACLKAGKDRPDVIGTQMRRYRAEGYPVKNGLVETMVLIRRHTKRVAGFCEAWCHEINNGSRRDQLSFNYVARKMSFPYYVFPETISNSPNFVWSRHSPRLG